MQQNTVRGITPENVVEMLANDSVTVTLYEAKLILDWMYNLANIALDVYTEKMLKDQANEAKGSNPIGFQTGNV